MTDEPTTRAQLVAARIRAMRVARAWSLRHLSEQMPPDRRLAVGQLSKIELGDRQISIDELATLAETLNTTPEHLMRPGEMCPTCKQEMP
jgi:transcriptional regulator with XRE-family HTH domain